MANHTHPSTLQLRNATCKIVSTLLSSRRYTSLRQAFFRVLDSVSRSSKKTNQTIFTGFELSRKEQNTPQKLYKRFVEFAKSPQCQEQGLVQYIQERNSYAQTHKIAA